MSQSIDSIVQENIQAESHRLKQKQKQKQKQWKLGLSLLSVVVLFWVLSSFLINLIFENNSYRKPFFITYINTASFTAYLIIPLTKEYMKMKRNNSSMIDYKQLIVNSLSTPPENSTVHPSKSKSSEITTNNNGISTSVDENSVNPFKSQTSTESDHLLSHHTSFEYMNNDNIETYTNNSGEHGNLELLRETIGEVVGQEHESTEDEPQDPLDLKSTIKLSAQFCLLWFLANFVTNASLSYTSVGSQTILSSTSSFFTLLLGYLSRLDRTISPLKIVGLFISLTGIFLVTKSDIAHTHLSKENNPKLVIILFGNFLAILGALLYGIYSTLLKLKVKNVNRINMHVFFGFVGLITIFLLWPTIILLNYTGYETFQIPPTRKIWSIIIINLIINFLSDYCWCKAMLLTSPLTVTVGLSTTIPFAMFGDFLFKGKKITLIYLLGASMILLSFFIIDREEKDDQKDEITDTNGNVEVPDNDNSSNNSFNSRNLNIV